MATRKAQTLIKAARANDPASQLELGRLYLSGGEGMAANPPAAFHWLSKAMASGCKEAAAEIATGIRPDAAFANPTAYARACTIASQSGSASANRILGELLLTGHGVAADFEAALSAFRVRRKPATASRQADWGICWRRFPGACRRHSIGSSVLWRKGISLQDAPSPNYCGTTTRRQPRRGCKPLQWPAMSSRPAASENCWQ